jgi:hypothetical protein
MALRLSDRATRRRVGCLSIVLAVLTAHVLITRELAQSRAEWGEAHSAPPARLEVAFVRELVPTAPPPRVQPPKPKPSQSSKGAVAAQPAASAPQEVASVPEPALSEPVVAEAPPLAVEAASAPETAASEPAAPPFEWPPSTRLKYRLSGYWRGDIHGGAQVQWIRVGLHYQVHLDVWLGPPFARLGSRRMTSDGELTDAGLKPHRYDEDTKVMFTGPRQVTVRFEPDTVVLANGRREPVTGAQDTASQFVQLTWLFTTQPQLLTVGNAVELPVALPRRLYRWRYEVVGRELLHTPVGDIDTFHVKPRIEAKGGDITAEIWFAPALQNLPVRILLRQAPDTHADLLLETRPTQAQQ